MLHQIISLHGYFMEALLVTAILNGLPALLLKQQIEKMVFWTRIGYFAFWMLWSMGVFIGLIAFVFDGSRVTFSILLMSVTAVVLGVAEGYRAIHTKRLWLQGLDASRFLWGMLALEILLIVTVSFYELQMH